VSSITTSVDEKTRGMLQLWSDHGTWVRLARGELRSRDEQRAASFWLTLVVFGAQLLGLASFFKFDIPNHHEEGAEKSDIKARNWTRVAVKKRYRKYCIHGSFDQYTASIVLLLSHPATGYAIQ